ncbi:Hsp20/alpha crystallin family protein [Algiphilus sp.]|uniref:Hsp20/alpha crystallin family protein n=1 Tax=Algiphilus sp. TaxID=1872431 RepID=UPI0025BBE955|nr:Hsp20/alpha crystallin family protein [Algiphilus sp.]
MELTHWNPFRELDQLFARQNRAPARTFADEAWLPTVDISETDKAYTITAELAGMDRKDIEVNVDNGVLTIAGERKHEKKDEGEKHHRVERFYGRFERSFNLPENVVQEKVAAECRDGVLRVTLPKTEISHAGPKRIAVG